MSNWIDTKDLAKLIRADLKRQLPKIKFTVRISRYSMGSSITVRFKNEADAQIPGALTTANDIADRYKGKGFDGMTDSSYYIPIMIGGEEFSNGAFIFVNV